MTDKITDEERVAIEVYTDAIVPDDKPKRIYRQKKPVRNYPPRIFEKLASSRVIVARRPKVDLSSVSVLRALEWAFRDECAQLNIPDRQAPEQRGRGFGMEFVMIEQARLGCQVDTSIGSSSPHEDAEVVAAIVSNLSQDLGGYRGAIQIAELSRSGLTPEWMPGAVPRIEPIEWAAANQFGRQAKSKIYDYCVEVVRTAHPKNPTRFIERTKKTEIRYTPCRWSPSKTVIDNCRDRYTQWWLILNDIRNRLVISDLLRNVGINDEMPPKRPWTH